MDYFGGLFADLQSASAFARKIHPGTYHAPGYDAARRKLDAAGASVSRYQATMPGASENAERREVSKAWHRGGGAGGQRASRAIRHPLAFSKSVRSSKMIFEARSISEIRNDSPRRSQTFSVPARWRYCNVRSGRTEASNIGRWHFACTRVQTRAGRFVKRSNGSVELLPLGGA